MSARAGLIIHRAIMVVIAPFVWVLGTLAYIVVAPILSGDAVWSAVKKHWNDQ